MPRPSRAERPAPWVPIARMAALVAVGGAIGTAARAHLETTFAPAPGTVPWVTLIINVAGSFALGALLELLLRTGPDIGRRKAVRLGCGTGVIGGFTTYSTFIVEIGQLARDGHLLTGATYTVVSLVAGLAAAGAGLLTVDRIVRHRASGDAAR